MDVSANFWPTPEALKNDEDLSLIEFQVSFLEQRDDSMSYKISISRGRSSSSPHTSYNSLIKNGTDKAIDYILSRVIDNVPECNRLLLNLLCLNIFILSMITLGVQNHKRTIPYEGMLHHFIISVALVY